MNLWRLKGASEGEMLPRQLPEREHNGQFVVELLKLVERAEDKLSLVLAFPHNPHHVGLPRQDENTQGL